MPSRNFRGPLAAPPHHYRKLMTIRYKTARCILYRDNRYLLAVHGSFWRAAARRWGLPGGGVEWGESPRAAAARELSEELNVRVPALIELGAWPYKRAMHMVYAAPYGGEIDAFDENELLEIGWFTEPEVAGLKARGALHADYELEAIHRLRAQQSGLRQAAVG
jgi:ADP-ribose pyrophosphatase YjhB (NUDIX family)